MRPSRSRLTTSPDLGSRGRASARGSRTSTPPCMMGAVIMKMMRSTNATSTSDVTLMSALSGSSPCPRSPPPPTRPATLQPPLASHRPDDLLGEALQLAREEPEAVDEDVVGDHGGHGDREPRDRRDQRLGDARRDRGDVPRAAERDADEGVHHAQHRAEEAEQGTHGSERREPRNEARRRVAL